VSGDDIVGLIIAVLLLGFLIFALVAPERLS
jgi:K+-transporting ATPase KdpF subunit